MGFSTLMQNKMSRLYSITESENSSTGLDLLPDCKNVVTITLIHIF